MQDERTRAGHRGELTNPARRLPDLRLRSVAGGGEVGIRPPGRKAPVLVFLHGAGCPDCDGYIHRLEDRRAGLEEWDGCVTVILSEEEATEGDVERAPRTTFPELVDVGRRLSSALRVQAPATVVADQWGEIHSIAEAGPGHRFSPPDEVVEWARYLAVQCPECQGEAL